MKENNDSLIEIALEEMKKKKKPKTLDKIAKEVFEIKGLSAEEAKKALPQFKMDFMICGHFICCASDNDKVKLWDLKSRQPSSLLDKDGSYLEDLYSDDEDVIKNELTDDDIHDQPEKDYEIEYDDDDEEEEDEKDEIEEELLSGDYLVTEEDSAEDSYDDDDENM